MEGWKVVKFHYGFEMPWLALGCQFEELTEIKTATKILREQVRDQSVLHQGHVT